LYTQFAELDAFLAGLVGAVRDILGDAFVGAYLQGSFALGAGDHNSDCAVIIAVTTLPTGPAEAELRRLHASPAARVFGPSTWKGPMRTSVRCAPSTASVHPGCSATTATAN
jgi:predicted nucleotidyltransferase